MTNDPKIKIHHPADPKLKVTVTEDAIQAYLDSGYVRTEVAAK